tara:strand:+ start:5160 stop:5516 length:357 start_codon:yes stop_codon:yes gene_type:complete
MSSKIYNKEYIVSIDRNETLVQIKIDKQSLPLNYKFNTMAEAITFSVSIVNAKGFLNFNEMSDSIKKSSESLRTAEIASTEVSKPNVAKPKETKVKTTTKTTRAQAVKVGTRVSKSKK